MKTALITGSAGFIGFHAAQRWLKEGWKVVGLDAFTEYYDPELKRARSAILEQNEHFLGVEGRLETPDLLRSLLEEHRPSQVVHMAAQAGVRYSIDAPRSYVEANVVGTFELLEAARAFPPELLLLASTSSVYGANTTRPYGESQRTDHQMSFYAATKKATEAMAHSYAHLYDLPTVMLRFFTVYGPWGRPDMALYKFVKAILAGEPIDIYNHGLLKRDFTYIDDLIEAIWRLGLPRDTTWDRQGPYDSLSPVARFRAVNIGKSQPDRLMDFVEAVEAALGQSAIRNMLEMQPGDVRETHSDTRLLTALTGFEPTIPLRDGIPQFLSWYRHHYGV